MTEMEKVLFTIVLLKLLVVNTSATIQLYQLNESYINVLSKSAIKVVEDVDSESFLTCISIKTSNSEQSVLQHADIINNIASGVANGMSIISSEDGNSSFDIGLFKERKRFIILVVDGFVGFR